MSDKHTPGMWAVVGFTVHAPDRGRAGHYQHVCDVDQNEQAAANARLIAVAPELLAACKAMDRVELGGRIHWVHNAANTTDIEALRAIVLAHGDVWNNLMRHAVAKAEKGA